MNSVNRFDALIASAKAAEKRKARRQEKGLENSSLMALNGSPRPQGALEGSNSCPSTPKRLKSNPRRSNKKTKRPKSPTLSKLKKELWREMSLLVRSWSPVCLACNTNPTECAAHIVPANDGAATRFFLPNLYPCCFSCNESERRQRGSWVYRHREMFGYDFVDALYALSDTIFEIKRWWVKEQTERVKRLRLEAPVWGGKALSF